jgi:hypothetical protein
MPGSDTTNDTGFDIFDIGLTRAEDGVPFPVPDLRTGKPILIRPEIRDETGAETSEALPLTITLLGRASRMFTETMKTIQADRDTLQERGKTLTREIIYDEDTRLLCACTVSWTFDRLKGQPFPCSPKNIRQFWTDRIFNYVRERALAFILGDVNFLPDGSKLSSDTPDTSSASPSPSPITAE